MEITLGVIGPEDSVNHILNSSEAFSDLKLIPFYYKNVEQIEEIIKHNKSRIDQWFFSGQVPYTYAISKGLVMETESFYPPLYGASLLGKVVESYLDMGKVLKRISLDTIQESELETTKRYFSLQKLEIYSYSYPDFRPVEEVVEYHRKLYEEGKTEVAFTCLRGVFEALRGLNIPCYRIFPSHLSIYFALRVLKERGESSWYQRSQLALLGVEVIQPANEDEFFYSYEQKHKELNLKRLLIEIAERINGSFVQIGDGLYFIYTTRGEIEIKLDKKDLHHLIDTVNSQTGFQLRIGLGYGITALQAEENVRTAFRSARKHTTPKIVLVDEDQEVTEFTSGGDSITYYLKDWISGEWADKLKRVNISPSSLSKIQALSTFYKKEEVNSQEVAGWLESSERNARRVLAELEALGLASSKSVQVNGSKGRPRKVYKLLFNGSKKASRE
ncbi:hypothetical protein [Pseudalkalibacillus caeni]|uniref:Transcriptional regulator n=1 Tax=Exobacillus caeni TaxID=2574798 RepID=A0A5R9F850_9BACL|nr:hypothetical protein [Pseudalkalibacillus caeni]TLS38699.1 hypothetical protein FCL54_04140 [Pseudalkalibacillus caeni]